MSVRLSLSWTYLAQTLNFLISFVSSIIVARLVSPRDFGIFAMAVAITTVLNVLMQLGLAKYIMREPTVDRNLLRSLFTVNAVLTAFYVVAILAGSVFATKVANSVEVAGSSPSSPFSRSLACSNPCRALCARARCASA